MGSTVGGLVFAVVGLLATVDGASSRDRFWLVAGTVMTLAGVALVINGLLA